MAYSVFCVIWATIAAYQKEPNLAAVGSFVWGAHIL